MISRTERKRLEEIDHRKAILFARAVFGIGVALGLFIAYLLCSCSVVQTIRPQETVAHAASFDSTTPAAYPQIRNSGILEYERTGKFVVRVLVTQGFVDYANWLIEAYGDQLEPPLKEITGITTRSEGVFVVPKDTFDRLRIMARWQKNGRAKTGAVKRFIDKVL